MAGLGSTDSLPAYEKEYQFYQSWDYPESDAEFSSQVLAVADYVPSLNKRQVQFIYDYYKQRVKDDEVEVGDLLNECDQYETRLPTFLESLNDTSQTSSFEVVNSSESAASPSSSTPAEHSPPETVDGELVEGATGGDVVDGKFSKTASKIAHSVGHKIAKSVKSSSSSKKSTRDSGNVPEVAVPDEKLAKFLLQNELAALQKEHELLEVNRKCIGCKVANRDIAFLPCGHFLMCKSCAEPIYECQKCGKDILATAQTFLS